MRLVDYITTFIWIALDMVHGKLVQADCLLV